MGFSGHGRQNRGPRPCQPQSLEAACWCHVRRGGRRRAGPQPATPPRSPHHAAPLLAPQPPGRRPQTGRASLSPLYRPAEEGLFLLLPSLAPWRSRRRRRSGRGPPGPRGAAPDVGLEPPRQRHRPGALPLLSLPVAAARVRLGSAPRPRGRPGGLRSRGPVPGAGVPEPEPAAEYFRR